MPRVGGKREGAGRKPGVPNIIKKSLQGAITGKDVKLALGTLRGAMRSDNWKAKVSAAQYVLDQKFGKARQATDITFPEGVRIIKDNR